MGTVLWVGCLVSHWARRRRLEVAITAFGLFRESLFFNIITSSHEPRSSVAANVKFCASWVEHL